jgi:hypothetical protein
MPLSLFLVLLSLLFLSLFLLYPSLYSLPIFFSFLPISFFSTIIFSPTSLFSSTSLFFSFLYPFLYILLFFFYLFCLSLSLLHFPFLLNLSFAPASPLTLVQKSIDNHYYYFYDAAISTQLLLQSLHKTTARTDDCKSGTAKLTTATRNSAIPHFALSISISGLKFPSMSEKRTPIHPRRNGNNNPPILHDRRRRGERGPRLGIDIDMLFAMKYKI